MTSIQGKAVLITGGGSGIGQAAAKLFLQAGASVAIAGRDRAKLDAAATALGGQGRILCHAADVSDPEQAAALVRAVEKHFGKIDILVNNAGTNIRGSVEQLSEADWDTVIDTNLKGPFLVSRAIGPRMVKQGWGRVINLGSTLSVIALPGRAPYASSKAGVLNLSRVLALEWAGTGVTVNTICPGPFATEMNRQLLDDPAKYKALMDLIPMGRWGEVEELAGVVVFLASDASSFMTGSAVFVDGGWTAR